METSLIVVDDFLDGAEALRAQALTLSYPDLPGPFPGRNSVERINISGLAEQVSQLTGEWLQPPSPPMSHAKCRITLARDDAQPRVHIDPGYWSGILYLSAPEDCSGGTEFFRHRRTRTDRAPATREELAALGYASWDAMVEDIVQKDGGDPACWEMTMRVPMRFNRLILLRPWLWHTAGPGFGSRPEDGRLVYLMFFSPARAGGAPR